MSVASQGVAEWLYSAITNAGTATTAVCGTRVFEDVAPQGTVTMPHIVFSQMSQLDVRGLTTRLTTEGRWLVKICVQEQSFKTADRVFSEVDAALDGKAGTATAAGMTVKCTRESEVRQTEVVNGKTWKHLGGIYHTFTG